MGLNIKEKAGTTINAVEILAIFGIDMSKYLGDLALQEAKREISDTAAVLVKHLAPLHEIEEPSPIEIPDRAVPITQVIERPQVTERTLSLVE